MSFILADTSVWIDFFSFPKSPVAQELDLCLKNDLVSTMDLIVAEILSGCKTQRQFQKLKTYLATLPKIHPPENTWEKIASTRFRLARKGFQASIPDLFIALTASHHEKVLFTKDEQFKAISTVVSLELKWGVKET